MLKIQRKSETVSKTLRLPINVVRKLDRIACINQLVAKPNRNTMLELCIA